VIPKNMAAQEDDVVPARMVRTTTIIAAPPSTVSAVLLDAATVRDVLASVGIHADLPADVLVPGAEIRVSAPCDGVFRLVDVTARTIDLDLGPATGRFRAHCVATPGGTSLTCTMTVNAGTSGLTPRALLTAITRHTEARATQLRDAGVVVGAAIIRDGLVLAGQRAYPAEAAGRWELPGGRVEPAETDQQAVRRECHEELGVAVEPGEPIGPAVVLGNGMLLRVYRAELAGDTEPIAREHRCVRWLDAAGLTSVDWLRADQVFLPELHRLLG
jgi:8-oxo-dGTP diphosphatase